MTITQVLEGKVAIVTGGGRGIGRAEAMALAAHGARVVVNATSDSAEEVAAEIRATGGEAFAHRGSIADYNEAGGLVRAALARYGRLDILLNNAGTAESKLLLETTPAEWDTMLAVNLTGHFNTIHHAAKIMMDQKSGRIINTASATWRGTHRAPAYAASKAAVVALTWSLARDFYGSGITCNAIAPFGKTGLVMKTIAVYDRLAAAGEEPAEMGARYTTYPPPEFAAPLVVYLASDHAADITGLIFRCGGGKVAVYSHPNEMNAIHKDISNGEPWAVDDLIERVPRDVLAGLRPYWQ
jgi:NAD(P)-dependent dehydrogenase (short-subunit alcohol dehydrogenase family)